MPPHDTPWLSVLLDPEAYVRVIQWSSITVTALTGVYEARKRDLDFLGVLVIAFVSAVGGGTLRDLLLDVHPIFWIQEPIHLITIALVSALGTAALVATDHREEAPVRRGLWGRAEVLLQPVSTVLRRPPLWTPWVWASSALSAATTRSRPTPPWSPRPCWA